MNRSIFDVHFGVDRERWRALRAARMVQGAVLVSCACSNSVPETCLKAIVQPIFGGASHDAYLGLGSQRENAVVALQVQTGDDGAPRPCSGVLVTASWVLTARHCISQQDARITVFFGERVDAPNLQLQAERWLAPDDSAVDVALIELPESVPPEVALPLRLSALEPSLLIGARLLMGGSGVTDDDLLGYRRFVTEEVTLVHDGFIIVDGRGKSGACLADSGSPAIWREGEPTIVGVLAGGDSSCHGIDSYVSTQLFRDWVERTVLAEPLVSSDCGGLSTTGGCFDSAVLQQATWCDDGRPFGVVCKDGETCGWSAANAGFRCVPLAADQCDGVSQLGACRGARVARCSNGVLEEEPCEGCACAIAPASGSSRCL